MDRPCAKMMWLILLVEKYVQKNVSEIGNNLYIFWFNDNDGYVTSEWRVESKRIINHIKSIYYLRTFWEDSKDVLCAFCY